MQDRIGRQQHAHVIPLGHQAFFDTFTHNLVHLYFNLWVTLRKALKMMWQEVAQDGVAGSQSQRAFDGCFVVRHAQRIVNGRKHVVCMAQETPPGIREFNAM